MNGKPSSAGSSQRITALNLFCKDIYHDQRSSRKVIPPELIYGAKMFRREMLGIDVPRDVYIHICGTDLIRDSAGNYMVLEDNGRTPSGVSYVLENRAVMKRVAPTFSSAYRVRAIEDYPYNLLQMLKIRRAQSHRRSEHRRHDAGHLQLGVLRAQLPRAADGRGTRRGPRPRRRQQFRLHAHDRRLRRVDVIYRRVDDDFLDPLCFRPDSTLGVAGLMNAYRIGNVALVNAPAPVSRTTRRSIPTCRT
jgi:uncharacterized circularly permuted ATP-grasp superfamily protein